MYVNRVLRPVAEKGVLEPIQAINWGQNGLLTARASLGCLATRDGLSRASVDLCAPARSQHA